MFLEKLSQLEQFTESKQKQSIEEMNKMVDEMNNDELFFFLNLEMFNKIHEMIEEEKLSMENTLLLLKHVGYSKELKGICIDCFKKSSLIEIFEKKIIEEEKKMKEEKDGKLLIDLCECYALFFEGFFSNLFQICVPFLLKVSLNKEEYEETEKKVEMALFALSHINRYCFIEQELYVSEIKEIIKYHQEHHNLTRFAYQSAWMFLMYRFHNDQSLEDDIVNDLRFVREVTRELEELTRCIDWKRKEADEVFVVERWLYVVDVCFFLCTLWNEGFDGLMSSIVLLLRAAREYCREISKLCISLLKTAAENKAVKIDDMLNGGAFKAVLEEILQPTFFHSWMINCLLNFLRISERLKEDEDEEDEDYEKEEEKRKTMKRKVFEKLEEEGYEDCIASLYGFISFDNKIYYLDLSLNISDYFVNV